MTAASSPVATQCSTIGLRIPRFARRIRKTARTYAWRPTDKLGRVVAYFAIAPTEVTRDGLSDNMSGKRDRIPGYLIANPAPASR